MVISSNLKEMKDKKTGVEIISVHVPKTAGSAFTRVLFKVYSPEAVFLDYPYEKDYQRQFMKEGDANVRVIHGHFPGSRYKHKFADAKRIIWLREPVNFLISYYCFNKVFRRTVFYDLLQQKNFSFWEFAQIPENQNIMSVYLRDMKLEDFFFVGIQEFFEEDLQQLKNLLFWPDVTVSQENNNIYSDYQRIKKEVFNDRSIVKKVATLNSEDMEIYKQALSLREKRCSQTLQKPQKNKIKQQQNQQVRSVVKSSKIEHKSNPVKEAIANNNLENLFDSKLWCKKGHLNPDQAIFISNLCKIIQPKNVLETGFATGRSAAVVLSSCSPKTFISLDKNLDYITPFGREMAAILMGEFQHYQIIEGDSNEFLNPEFYQKNYSPGLDLFTVNGDHSYKGCFHDLESSLPFLNPQGIIIVDDYKSKPPKGVRFPAVNRAVRDFCNRYPEVHKLEWHKNGKGLAILSKSPKQLETITNLLELQQPKKRE